MEPSPTPAPTPEPVPSPEPFPSPTPVPAPVPEPSPEPFPSPTPVPGPEPTPTPAPVPGPLPDPAPVPQPDPVPAPDPVRLEQPVAAAAPTALATAEEPAPQPEAPRVRREPRHWNLPRINPWAAVAVTGIVCGLIVVVLSFGSLRGCEAVRGVGTCGGFGLFALLVILLVSVLVGAALLGAWRISDPTSTSFLGVGILTVIALVFFLGALESVWMFVVIPVVAAIAFALSHWVTASFVDVGDPPTR